MGAWNPLQLSEAGLQGFEFHLKDLEVRFQGGQLLVFVDTLDACPNQSQQ